MKPTILYTTSAASPQSGAFRILLDLSRSCQQHGYDTILALPQQDADANHTLLDPLQLRSSRFLPLPQARRNRTLLSELRFLSDTLQSAFRLARIIRQEKVHIVHVNEITDIYGALAAKISGVKCVWSVRAGLSPWPLLKKILPLPVLQLADYIVVASRSVEYELFSDAARNGHKIQVVYEPGFDLTDYRPDIDGAVVRQQLKLSPEQPVVTLIAKLTRIKGHDVLINAVPHVLKAHPESRFLIVGGELEARHHQRYVDELHSLIREQGLQDKVIFTGYRADIPQVLAASDLVVHCATYPDPFPGVVLQGMAMGKAVIASDAGGTGEQIENGVSGILVESGNSLALADAINRLLQDEHLREQLGLAALQRVHNAFNFSSYHQAYADIYDQVLRTTPPAFRRQND